MKFDFWAMLNDPRAITATRDFWSNGYFYHDLHHLEEAWGVWFDRSLPWNLFLLRSVHEVEFLSTVV
jgi:hypothetical protein